MELYDKVNELTKKTSEVSKNIAKNIIKVTGFVAENTVKTVSSTVSKINTNIEEKKTENSRIKQEEKQHALGLIDNPDVLEFIECLGDSPVNLTKGNTAKIKKIFPLPKEQTVLWADAEFDLKPSGIVATERGVFIRTNVDFFNIKKSQKNEKIVLYYYSWSDFEAQWFISESKEENMALCVEKQCSERFVLTCKNFTEKDRVKQNNIIDFDIANGNKISHHNISGAVVSANNATANNAVFVQENARMNTLAGHGLMAEQGNNMLDRLSGLDAKVVGGDNAKNGADRQIGSDIFIQTKYYKSATGTLESSFSADSGNYRYFSKDGKPMQLEVPKDQYAKVLEKFKVKIEKGKVPGVTDPNEAVDIVRKGRLTYKNAVNITKAGTIESLMYDVGTGAVVCSCAFGISFVTTLVMAYRKTGNMNTAIKSGVITGGKVFGMAFIQHIAVSQISRIGIVNSLLLKPSEFVVKKMGSKATSTIVNGIRATAGKNAIHGAAASKSLAKLLRSNVLTSTITFAVISIPDTYKVVNKKISNSQYMKNMTVLASSVVAGAGGALAAGVIAAKVAGAASTVVAPGVGTAIGIVGGLVGGTVGSLAIGAVGNMLCEDDIAIWSRYFNSMISCMVNEYMLQINEIDELIANIGEINQKELQLFFETLMNSECQEEYIRDFLAPYFDAIVSKRELFRLPNLNEMMDAVDELYSGE